MAYDTWQEVDYYVIDFFPGIFAGNGEKKEYNIHGTKVEGFNYAHAEYLWVRNVVGDKCVCCGHRLKHIVIFKDTATNEFKAVGRDCAVMVDAKYSKRDWKEKGRMIYKIKKVKTKNGERFTYQMDMPYWYWDIPKDERPKFTSCSKWNDKWYLTVWGQDTMEVLTNFETLNDVFMTKYAKKALA